MLGTATRARTGCLARQRACFGPASPQTQYRFISLQGMMERLGNALQSQEKPRITPEVAAAAKRRATKRKEDSLFERVRHHPAVSGESEKQRKREIRKIDTRPHWHKPRELVRKVDLRTDKIKISPRKLTMLASQISGKPIDYALIQMKFSEKRASKHVAALLEELKTKATLERMPVKKLVVSEAWVGKALAQKRIDIKGRGRFGVRTTRYSHLHVVLRQGLTEAERLQKVREYKLGRVRSAGLVREDTPLRNVGPTWAW